MNNGNTWYRLPDRNVLVAIGIIMVSTFFDALRDGCSDYVSWLAWHAQHFVRGFRSRLPGVLQRLT